MEEMGVGVQPARVVRSGPEAMASKDQDTLSHLFVLSPPAAKMRLQHQPRVAGQVAQLRALLPAPVTYRALVCSVSCFRVGAVLLKVVSRAVSENLKNAYAWRIEEWVISKPD